MTHELWFEIQLRLYASECDAVADKLAAEGSDGVGDPFGGIEHRNLKVHLIGTQQVGEGGVLDSLIGRQMPLQELHLPYGAYKTIPLKILVDADEDDLVTFSGCRDAERPEVSSF